MCYVMPPVPGIQRQSLLERHRTECRVPKSTFPLGVAKFAEHEHPALMQRIEQCQRYIHGGVLSLWQFGPKIFCVRLDGWFVFGEREFETNVGIHVAIGKVMRQLARRPTTIAVGRVQLRI